MAEPDTTTIQGKYTARLAEDLDANHQEQDRLREQIAELRTRLEQVRTDEAWLVEARGRLADEAAAQPAQEPAGAGEQAVQDRADTAAGGEEPAATAVPAPRRTRKSAPKAAGKKAKATEDAGPARSRRKPVRPAAAPTQDAPAQDAPAPDAPETGTKAAAGPSLRELVLDHLARHGEPRQVREVVGELTQSHPDRTVKLTVVRETCEALVAKGRLHRTKQGRSVYYTAPLSGPEAVAPAQPVEAAESADAAGTSGPAAPLESAAAPAEASA